MRRTLTNRLANLAWATPRRAAVTAGGGVALLLAIAILVPAVRDITAGVIAVGGPLTLLGKAFPNESKQLAARIFARLSPVSQLAEREAVRQDLEGTLSLGAARLASVSPSDAILPLRIDYLRSGDQVERLPDGTLVVGVAHHQNRDRNLVAAAWAYVQHGVLADSRSYLDPDVSRAINFVLARMVLASAGPGALREFLKSLWDPAVVGEDRLRNLCAKLDRLQEDQLLGPIVLSEFQELATSLGFRLPTESVQAESARFVEYLYDLAVREHGAKVGDQTNFDGDAIRCRVVFVARPDVYALKGPSPHRQAIDWAIRRAYHRVYLLGLGRHEEYVREVAAPYSTDRRVRDVSEFSGLRRYQSGRVLKQVVIRITVDVRYHVSIGQRPAVAVGPGPHLAESARVQSG